MEIDVLAYSVDEKYLLAGECKWNEKDVNNQQLIKKMKKKAELLPFAKGKTIIPVLFLKNGNRENSERVFFPEDILLS
jgi:hypothetical protein